MWYGNRGALIIPVTNPKQIDTSGMLSGHGFLHEIELSLEMILCGLFDDIFQRRI